MRLLFVEVNFRNHSVPFSSAAQSCLTLCDRMNRSMPGLPVRHQLPEFIKAKQTVTSMKQIQVLALGNLWIFKKYFLSEDG